MQERPSASLPNKILSLPQTVGIIFLSLLCGLPLSFGVMLGNIEDLEIGAILGLGLGVVATVFASLFITVLSRRRGTPFALVAAVAYSAVAVLVSGSVVALFLSLAAWAGGLYMAYAVEKGEGRVTTTASISLLYLLILIALAAYLILTGAQAAGESDLWLYVGNQLDRVADEVTASQMQSYEMVFETYEKMGVEVSMPTEGEVHLTVVRVMSLLPGILVLGLLALALVLTYLTQLAALALASGPRYTPLFRQENRTYRIGTVFSVIFLLVWLVARFWTDFTSPLCLVLQNAALVMTPVMAFGGILGIPAFFRFLLQGTAGNRVSLIWILLFALLCISYLRYAITVFALVYAVYILKNAFSRKNEEK
ncbi:MAG: DUF2232 domain-containing protein [Clostridia bacterium]|nr:DUF2232 domain-containing protein [Clostridia bacterium]